MISFYPPDTEQSKYLSPWYKDVDRRYINFQRCLLTGTAIIGVGKKTDDSNWVSGINYDPRELLFKSKQEAMDYTDKALVESGYVLLDEEQYQRLRMLA